MISDAFVRITCNRCDTEEEVQLTAIARGGYDGRNLDGWLERNGWRGRESDGEHICPDCIENETETDPIPNWGRA